MRLVAESVGTEAWNMKELKLKIRCGLATISAAAMVRDSRFADIGDENMKPKARKAKRKGDLK